MFPQSRQVRGEAQDCIRARAMGPSGVCHKTAQQIESFEGWVEVNLLERQFGVKRLDLIEKAVQIFEIADLRVSQR